MNGLRESLSLYKSQIGKMMELGLYSSAGTLCSLILSSMASIASSGADSANMEIESIFELYGDAMYKNGELKRALSLFRRALQQTQLSYVQKRQRSGSMGDDDTVALKLKIANCLIDSKEYSAAQKELESVPHKFRTVHINLCLGQLYKASGLKRHSLASYKLAFEQMPFSIEIMESLVSLGMSEEELLEIIQKSELSLGGGGEVGVGGVGRHTVANPSLGGVGGGDSWFASIGKALVSKRVDRHQECDHKFAKLLTVFPRNSYLLGQLACASYEAGLFTEAITIFKSSRRSDTLTMDSMDVYGSALYIDRDITELNKLSHDLIAIDPKRPEGWLCVAMYSHLKEDVEKALVFVDKASQLAPKCAHAFRLKGKLLLQQQRNEQAVISYFQASSLEKHMDSYIGLVQANLAIRKPSEALAAARESVTTLPNSSQAHCLVGQVLSTTSGHGAQEEAFRSFQTALNLEPRCVDAAASMTAILLKKGETYYEAAISLLRETLQRVSSVKIITLLGKCLGLIGDFPAAIEQLNIAISMSKDSSEAIAELEVVESQMKAQGLICPPRERSGSVRSGGGASVDDSMHSMSRLSGVSREESDMIDPSLSGSGMHMGTHMRGSGSGGGGGGRSGLVSPVGLLDFSDGTGGSPEYYS